MFMLTKVPKLIISIVAFIILFPNVCSLGITPPEVYIDFYPGLATNLTFTIINNVGYDTYVMPTLRESPLAPYLTPLQTEPILIKTGGNTEITFQLKLPQQMETPGKNNVFVGAVETISPTLGGSGVSAKTGIAALITVFVPYPGKYLEIGFSGEDVANNEPVHFTVNLQNKGKEKLNLVAGNIGIYEGEKKIETLLLPETYGMNLYDRREITVNWSTIGRNVGVYRGELTLEYDGITKKRNTTFHIGNESLEIINFTKEVEAEKISKFAITVQSVWNSKFADVWAEVNVRKGGKIIQILKTPVTELGAWEQNELIAYFDGNGVATGEYNAEITVHYSGKTKSASGAILVIPPRKEAPATETAKPISFFTQSNIFIGIAALAIILLLINIFISLRRKK